ncbi:hypothetical protein D4740_05415 [Actinomyces sp. 2119]|uniref:Uncharacterized protein n=1 Tax=Actinomyces lilanjuaniae TaxID=2321394 RepID=A0ABM6Z2C1_9ACTO|nr:MULTISPECIES: hypothetical protein [Actinomyces]AYD89368.1 hypothetical protein D5R93_03550 [Actinomyces lilanjuaniae]RJF43280.1 hypothetical protein D4740_05415 [Actinomyces sp. 2119]
MRVFLPATATDLRAESLSPRLAHAATPTLARALPEEDQEGLEVAASLCAADASLLLLAQPGAARHADRRVVIAADAADDTVRELDPGQDVLPGTVEVTVAVDWQDVAAIFVDDAQAQADVRAARHGDEEAFERAAQADLLWYDVTERDHLADDLGA